MKVLGLGIAPILKPVDGGQRRIAAIRDGYAWRRIPFSYIAIIGHNHAHSPRDPHDIVAGPADPKLDRISELADLCVGIFASRSEECLSRISAMIRESGVTHIHLEQCFLFPLFERLRRSYPALRLIYSSQNAEAPLKAAILRDRGVDNDTVREVTAIIDGWEHGAARAAEILLVSSNSDVETYRRYGAKEIIVGRNGVGESPTGQIRGEIQDRIRNRSFMMTVGSSHQPNVEGVRKLILDQSFRFSTIPTLIICGGMASGLEAQCKPELASMRDAHLILVRQIADSELGGLKACCHGFFLPIVSGGGSNLKTAEALITGKQIVATSFALRGFTEFVGSPGVTVADSPWEFKDAIERALRSPLPELSTEEKAHRQSVRWEHSLSEFFDRLLQTKGQPI